MQRGAGEPGQAAPRPPIQARSRVSLARRAARRPYRPRAVVENGPHRGLSVVSDLLRSTIACRFALMRLIHVETGLLHHRQH